MKQGAFLRKSGEYFSERTEKAAKQLEKARSLQFKIWKSRKLFQDAVLQQPAGIKARKLKI